MEARKTEEIAFHDKLRAGQYEQRWSIEAEQRVAADALWSNFKYYSVERHSLALSQGWLRAAAPSATVLDYCCGNGEDALFIAAHGASRVVGIDISDVSIQNCIDRADAAGFLDRVHFQVMDAEQLSFSSDSFDLINEYGVLHHLDLRRALPELARVLKPNGQMICTETLGHNPLIARYRRRTPHLRTAWEADHILKRSDFQLMREYFGDIEMHFFHLATLAAVPFRKSTVFGPMVTALRAMDRVLLSLPGLRWQAWQVVFRLRRPLKADRA